MKTIGDLSRNHFLGDCIVGMAIGDESSDRNECRVRVKWSDFDCIGLLRWYDCDIGGSFDDSDGQLTVFDFWRVCKDGQNFEIRVAEGRVAASFGLEYRGNEVDRRCCGNLLMSDDNSVMAIGNIGDYDGRHTNGFGMEIEQNFDNHFEVGIGN